MTAADFRQTAREALRGKWRKLYFPFLIVSLVSSAFALPELLEYLFPEARSFLSWFLRLPELVLGVFSCWLMIGSYRIGCAVLDGEPVSPGMLFDRNHFGAGLLIGVVYQAFSFGLSLLTGLSILFSPLGIIVFILLFTAAVIFGFWVIFRCHASYYLLSQDKFLRFGDALGNSWDGMRGNVRRSIGLGFSFIGWFLLSVLAFSGIERVCVHFMGAFGAVPARLIFSAVSVPLNIYMTVAHSAFYRDIFREKSSS